VKLFMPLFGYPWTREWFWRHEIMFGALRLGNMDMLHFLALKSPALPPNPFYFAATVEMVDWINALGYGPGGEREFSVEELQKSGLTIAKLSSYSLAAGKGNLAALQRLHDVGVPFDPVGPSNIASMETFDYLVTLGQPEETRKEVAFELIQSAFYAKDKVRIRAVLGAVDPESLEKKELRGMKTAAYHLPFLDFIDLMLEFKIFTLEDLTEGDLIGCARSNIMESVAYIAAKRPSLLDRVDVAMEAAKKGHILMLKFAMKAYGGEKRHQWAEEVKMNPSNFSPKVVALANTTVQSTATGSVTQGDC